MASALVVALLAGTCTLTKLPITPVEGTGYGTYHATTKNFELVFDNPDKTPVDIFIEGFQIKDLKTGKVCDASGGINTEAYASADGAHVLSIAYSGSTTFVEMFRSDGCGKTFDEAFYTSNLKVDGGRVTVTPECECGSKDESDCQCDPGGVFETTKDCKLVRNVQASTELAEKELGLVITEPSLVFHPRKKDAKLLRSAKSMLAPLKNQDATEKFTDASYGCYYQTAADQKSSSRAATFLSGTDKDSIEERWAFVNVEGVDTRFELTAKTEPKAKKSKVGDKATRDYKAVGKKGLTLHVEFVVKSVCNPKSGCESDDRSLTITVDDGKRKETADLVGYCAI